MSAYITAMSLFAVVFLLAKSIYAGEAYNPVLTTQSAAVQIVDYTLQDGDRGREIPIRVYLPESQAATPVVLFSHGLGGSRENNPYLGKHWADAGYVVVFIQHIGSDASVWKDVPGHKRLAELKDAASRENAVLRFEDVSFVLDQLEVMNVSDNSALSGRMDLDKIGMSGHSFGAVTTQWVTGQKQLLLGAKYKDERIDAALAMSPSAPRAGRASRAFGDIEIPWLSMTGTEDVSMIGGADVESRLAVYKALPDGDKYELFLHGATHMAFSERELRSQEGSRNPNHHNAILKISTAFWDAYLKEDTSAEAWLRGDAKSVLEEQDRWQWK
ncbi:MAG: alpha/beta hydrolase family protein [Opitutaceae bacterium]